MTTTAERTRPASMPPPSLYLCPNVLSSLAWQPWRLLCDATHTHWQWQSRDTHTSTLYTTRAALPVTLPPIGVTSVTVTASHSLQDMLLMSDCANLQKTSFVSCRWKKSVTLRWSETTLATSASMRNHHRQTTTNCECATRQVIHITFVINKKLHDNVNQQTSVSSASCNQLAIVSE